MADTDVVRVLAAWALVHEMADEGWKAAVDRGLGEGDTGEGPGDLVDGISGLIYREKERLKGELASMDTVAPPGASTPADDASEEMRFELAEMRGRLEAIEAALDSLARRLDAGSAGK